MSGLVLAAGASRRFGRPKQLLAWRDTTLLGWVIRQASGARGLDELIVVIGGAADEVRTSVEFGRARVIQADDFAEGCAASYRSGMAALDERADAVTVLLGDQPGIDSSTINRVVQTWREAPSPIVVSSYRGRIGHPIIFARECFDALSKLSGDKAAWKIVDGRLDETTRVELDEPYPFDVNTPADYARLVETVRT